MKIKEIQPKDIFNDEKRKQVKEVIEQHKLKQREVELLKLGFEKNDHQQSWISFKYDQNYYVDFYKVLEYDNIDWIDTIENIKKSYRKAKNNIERSDEYFLGFNSAQKQIKQKIKNSYNHYNSKLQEELKPKFGKENYKTEKIKELEIKVATLKELLK